MRPEVESNSGLSAVLRAVVADMQHASGADIVSIFLYEEATHTYYAPFATGQPQESLLDSLTDMREQLARYLEHDHESAARSLREGMAEMFTVLALCSPGTRFPSPAREESVRLRAFHRIGAFRCNHGRQVSTVADFCDY